MVFDQCNGITMVSKPVLFWYHMPMDVNVKNLEDDVVERLAAQAAAEGVSQQEWMRQILRRSAARLSPAELLAQRSASAPMSEEEFATLRMRVAARKKSNAERLDATRRSR